MNFIYQWLKIHINFIYQWLKIYMNFIYNFLSGGTTLLPECWQQLGQQQRPPLPAVFPE